MDSVIVVMDAILEDLKDLVRSSMDKIYLSNC